MSADTRSLDTSLLAARLAPGIGTGTWVAYVVDPPDTVATVAEAISRDLREIANADVERLHVGTDAFDRSGAARPDAAQVRVVTGLESLSPDGWRHLDLRRSALRHDAGVVLVASRSALEQLAHHAPNLLSWIRSVDTWDPDAGRLTEPERLARVAALERWSGLGSDEVISRAARGELPPDPEYREWLVLLERGDLLAH